MENVVIDYRYVSFVLMIWTTIVMLLALYWKSQSRRTIWFSAEARIDDREFSICLRDHYPSIEEFDRNGHLIGKHYQRIEK